MARGYFKGLSVFLHYILRLINHFMSQLLPRVARHALQAIVATPVPKIWQSNAAAEAECAPAARGRGIPAAGTHKHTAKPASSGAPAQPIPKAEAEGLPLPTETQRGTPECPPASQLGWDSDTGRVGGDVRYLGVPVASAHGQKQGGARSSAAKL